MPLLYNKRVLLAKTESTYATDSIPTGAANAILVRNLDLQPIDSEQVDRDLVKPYFGADDILISNVRSRITFEVEMAGSGALGTAPKYGPILRACGMAEVVTASTKVTYTPVSESFSSCSIYVNIDGVTHRVTGCRGTVSLNMTVGQIPVYQFELMGIYNGPVDVAFSTVAAVYTGFQAPLVFNNTNSSAFQFHSYAAELQSLELQVGMDMVYRELVGNTKEVLLTNRRTGGTVQFDAVTMATKNYFTLATASTNGNCTVTHGTVNGNKVRLTVPRANITTINYVEANGITQYNVPFVALPSNGATGDDEFSIEVL
jgi:hypothetical protein